MEQPISEETLIKSLNELREIVVHFNFSEISNIIFFDMDSLSCYIKNCKDNPFERQYKAIEALLEPILPYIPYTISVDTLDVLNVLLNQQTLSTKMLRENILMSMKLDFIDHLREIQTESEWEDLVEECKELRLQKIHAKV